MLNGIKTPLMAGKRKEPVQQVPFCIMQLYVFSHSKCQICIPANCLLFLANWHYGSSFPYRNRTIAFFCSVEVMLTWWRLSPS